MKICPKCKTEHSKIGIFCSRSCANSRGPRTEEFKQKVRTKMIGRNVPNINKGKFLIERVKKLCAYCNKEFICKINDNKKYCSSSCVGHVSGGYKEKSGRSKTGYYRGIYCGSTYELAFLIWNLDNNKPVKRCDKIFNYIYKNQVRKYFPDFEINEKIYEIKGRKTDVDFYKIKASNAILIDSNLIKPYIAYVATKYKLSKNNLWKLYDNPDSKPCQCCGTQYIPTKIKSLYCSRSCSMKMNRRKAKKFQSP